MSFIRVLLLTVVTVSIIGTSCSSNEPASFNPYSLSVGEIAEVAAGEIMVEKRMGPLLMWKIVFLGYTEGKIDLHYLQYTKRSQEQGQADPRYSTRVQYAVQSGEYVDVKVRSGSSRAVFLIDTIDERSVTFKVVDVN